MGLIVVLTAVIGLIIETAPYSLLPLGALIWWGCYCIETALNGGKTSGLEIFEHVGNDFKNNFGNNTFQHRLNLARGDTKGAAAFPGKTYCICMHIILPLTPLLIWAAFS